MKGMATTTGIEYGYSVPIQLYPHTQALAAILLTDSDERFAHERDRDQSQQSRSLQQDGTQSKSSVWVIPPAYSALREQGKHLQQQKRAKQRQAIVLDASPSRFDVPDALQILERNSMKGGNCQLIGARPLSSQLPANSLHREPDGAVLVPLRMMPSLVITNGTADGAGAVTPGQQPSQLEELQRPSTIEEQQQLQGAGQATSSGVPLFAETPAGPSPARGPSGEKTHTGPQPSVSGTAAIQRSPRHRFHNSQPLGRHQPSLDVTVVHRRANSLSAATGNFLSLAPMAMEPERQQPLGWMQEGPPQPKHHPASYQQEAEEEDDGAMLIDVGSADRSAEGALLPTPDRPRVAGAGSGWDALRGLGLSGLGGDKEEKIAGTAAAGRIADTLAILSPFASTQQMETSGGLTATVPVGQQQQQLQLHSFDLARDEQARQRSQLPLLAQAEQRPSQQLLLPTRTDVEAAQGHTDEVFDADDEAETAQSTERARGAFRLLGRHPSLRPLPGLSALPPWAPTPHATHGSGLASFSSLAQALPVFLPTANSEELRRTAPGIPGSAMARLEADPALTELLKLKCSLRRAVQGQNSHAAGLILSLLGALPVTPELLAASQVAAVVEPLQHSNCTQVASAARHAMAVWKAVLKAAARRPASAGGHPAVQAVAGEPADGGCGGNAWAYAGAGTSHQHHSSHHLQRGSSLPHTGLHSVAHGSPREIDVSMRDQIDPMLRPVASAREGRQQLPGRHIPALSHARSRSDMIADGLLVACHLAEHSGPSATQSRSPRADVQGTRVASRDSLPACDGVAWITDSRAHGMQLGKQDKGGKDSGCSRGGRDSSPSESRTVTEGETGGRSSSEETSEEGHVAPPTGTATGDGGSPCGEQKQGSGGGSGSYSGATLSCSPLPAPTAAAATNGGAGGSLNAMPNTYLSPDSRTAFASHAAWPPTAGAARQPHSLQPLRLTGAARQMDTAVTSQAIRVSEACAGMCSPPACGGIGGALLPTVQSPWGHLGAAAAGFLPAHEGAGSEVLSLAIPPSTPAVAAVGPPGSLLLSPPGLPQPGNRKRKVDRSSSRRRSLNPSKRIASPAVPGPFQGLRASVPASLSGDVRGGISDDQRHLHGPVAGIKTPSRTSLLAQHAPLSKRQRHHASGAGGHGHGGGQSTATQVRRMSLLLTSLDLGHSGAVQASAESEGDADADADMGSQDDGAAMLTSDDDAMPTAVPCTNNGAVSTSPDTGGRAEMGALANGHAAMGCQTGNDGNGSSVNRTMLALARQRHVPFGAQGNGAGLVRTEEVGESEQEVLLISTGLGQAVQAGIDGNVIEQVSPAGYYETRRFQLGNPSHVPSGNYPFFVDAGDAGANTGS